MKHVILLCGAVLLPIFCLAKYGPSKVNPSDVTEKLQLEAVPLGDCITDPTGMTVSEDHLVMSLWKTPEFKFQIMKIPLTGESFLAGPIGRGPMDFYSNMDHNSLRSIDGGFEIGDESGLKRCHVQNNKIVIDNVDKIAGKIRPRNGLGVLSDGYVTLAARSSAMMEFDRYDEEGKFVESFSKYPGYYKSSEEEKLFIYLKKWCLKPDSKDLIAEFYCHFNRIRFIDLSGKVKLEIDTDFEGPSEGDVIERRCYTAVSSVTKKYIPVLHQSDDGSDIQIWTWSGKLVRRYLLPAKASSFAIDWSRCKLYCIDKHVEGTVFVADIMEFE